MKSFMLIVIGMLLHRYRKEVLNAVEDKVFDGIAFVKGDEYVDALLKEGPEKIDEKVNGLFAKLDEFTSRKKEDE